MADIHGEKNQHGGTSNAIFGGLLHRKALDHNRKDCQPKGQGMQHAHKATVEWTIIVILSN